ncbi:MAG: LysR family transcriptional regulator [Polyangiaceae bacterium]|nr:LysR family transcriptional regulator [Polyangiaceae bacterium]
MTPDKILSSIWPYLPVFRVVAETQHLPTAAKRLHVSASALSRTIRLVEEGIGEELFVRSSRRIVLNAAGERLLWAVRRGMGGLERSLTQVLERDFSGEYRVGALGVLTDYFVLPALLELSKQHHAIVPCLNTLTSRDANQRLGNGTIEVAFYYDATAQAGISCRKIGQLANSLYCGKGHPLFGRRATLSEVLEHPFSVPAIGDRGTPMDNWPVEVARKIGLQIFMLSTNRAVALSGRFVTVLPDVVAEPEVRARRLYRVPVNVMPDTDVYAACREEDETTSFTTEVIAAVQTRLASAPRLRKKKRS